MGKLSMALGLGVGYVLGAQAGRARYEQIKQAAAGLMGRPEVRQALDRARTAAPVPLQAGIEKLTRTATGGQDAGDATSAGQSAGSAAAAAPGAATPGRSDQPLPDPLIPPARSS